MSERKIIPEEQKAQIVDAAWRMGDIIHEALALNSSESRLKLDDLRPQGVDPFRRQTHSGLFLESMYGLPRALWTPWGSLRVASVGSSRYEELEDAREAIFGKIEATVFQKEEFVGAVGHVGPVHALITVGGGEALPAPSLVEDSEQFFPYEVAMAEWGRLCEQVGRVAV